MEKTRWYKDKVFYQIWPRSFKDGDGDGMADANGDGYITADDAAQIVTDAATVYLPLSELIDTEKERARLQKELEKTQGEIKRLDGKLSNAGFVAKAPANVVEAEKAKLEKYKETLAAIEAALAKLN